MAIPKVLDKNSFSVKIIMSAYFAFLFVAASLPSLEGMKCQIMIEHSGENKIYEECRKSNPVDYDKHPGPNATLESYDFDDNCNTQCAYKAFELLTPEGKVKKNQVATFLKGVELDGEVLDKITAIWNGCLVDAEKIGKEKGFNDCKMVSLHSFCQGSRISKEKVMERKCC